MIVTTWGAADGLTEIEEAASKPIDLHTYQNETSKLAIVVLSKDKPPYEHLALGRKPLTKKRN